MDDLQRQAFQNLIHASRVELLKISVVRNFDYNLKKYGRETAERFSNLDFAIETARSVMP